MSGSIFSGSNEDLASVSLSSRSELDSSSNFLIKTLFLSQGLFTAINDEEKKLTLFLRMENVALLFLKRRQTDFLAVGSPLTLVSYQSAEYEFISQSYI